MTLQDKQEAFLLDTILYYSADPVGRRCYSEKMGCYYSPVKIGKEDTSEGCAIGRHLTPVLQEELDIAGYVSSDRVFYRLPDNLQELGQDFLSNCQRLHDGSDNWDSNGLTFEGEEKVSSIVTEHKLNPTKFLHIINS